MIFWMGFHLFVKKVYENLKRTLLDLIAQSEFLQATLGWIKIVVNCIRTVVSYLRDQAINIASKCETYISHA